MSDQDSAIVLCPVVIDGGQEMVDKRLIISPHHNGRPFHLYRTDEFALFTNDLHQSANDQFQ